ncbi:MAG: lyase family protein [Pseudomonadota bacterium]
MTNPIFGCGDIRAHLKPSALCTEMVKVELALVQAQAEHGVVPDAAAANIRNRLESAKVDLDVLRAGVASAGVPVPELVKSLRAQLDTKDADWLHYGATSQDIVDTAYCLCFKACLSHIEDDMVRLIDLLADLSLQHADTLMLARTRGQLATPITLGLRLAQWAQPLTSLEAESDAVRAVALRVQLGGASGSRNVFGGKGAEVSKSLAAQLGLEDSAPWHMDRSGFRRLANWLSRIVSATAKIGRDFSIASRGEIGELRPSEGGASSTMPHKSNPVVAEALQSIVPVATACEAALAASSAHAEERDGANWPVEWVMMPMLLEATGAALAHALNLLDQMVVNADAMKARIDTLPDVKAEAFVFALAQEIGRVEATRVVTEALGSKRPMSELFEQYPELDLNAATSDAAFATCAAETAARIFADRCPATRTRGGGAPAYTTNGAADR